MSDTPVLYFRVLGSDDFRHIAGSSSPEGREDFYPIHAAQDVDGIRSEISLFMERHYADRDPKSWVIEDFGGFHGAFDGWFQGRSELLEYLRDHLEMVSSVAQLMDELSEGAQVAAFVRHLELPYVPDDYDELKSRFEDAYMGEYDSPENWAESYVDDTGLMDEILKDVEESTRYYVRFDYEGYARDARMSGDMDFIQLEHGGGTYVFSNHA